MLPPPPVDGAGGNGNGSGSPSPVTSPTVVPAMVIASTKVDPVVLPTVFSIFPVAAPDFIIDLICSDTI